MNTKKIHTTRVIWTLSVALICFMLLSLLQGVQKVFAADEIEILSYTAVLRDDDGLPLVGYFDFRTSFWKNEIVGNDELYTTKELKKSHANYLGFTEEQSLLTSGQGEFTVQLDKMDFINDLESFDQIYMQVEVKPKGTSTIHWEIIDTDIQTTQLERVYISKELYDGRRAQRVSNNFSGVLLDDAGVPLRGNFEIRMSYWSDPNIDWVSDHLGDNAIQSGSKDYLGYTYQHNFTTNEKGAFGIPLGSTDIAELRGKGGFYLEVEVKGLDEEMYEFEVIDPDADMQTNIDRFFAVPDGKGSIEFRSDTPPVPTRIQDDTHWMVSQIPAGTSEKRFEIGAGGDDPNAVIELVANQGNDKKGVIRFNGVLKRWEVSNDGIHFFPILSIDELLKGTKNDTFTIGLGDTDHESWSLLFGDVLTARIEFDSVRDQFIFHNDVDFNQNEARNFVLERLEQPPENPVEGQQYYNLVDHKAYYFDGTWWRPIGSVTNVYGGPQIIQQVSGGGGGGTTTSVDLSGTPFETFTFDNDNTGAGNDVNLVANQGTDPDGTLRYNATTNQWEISNDGGAFSAIVDADSTQTLTNKTLDGDDNTFADIPFSALKERTKTIKLSAEYDGVAVHEDGADNKGILRNLRDIVNDRNYYSWTANNTTTEQDIDLMVEVPLPEDFVSFQSTPITIEYRTELTTTSDNVIDFTIEDTTGAPAAVSGGTSIASTVADTWELASLTFTGSPTFTANGRILIQIKLTSKGKRRAEVAQITLNYNGR